MWTYDEGWEMTITDRLTTRWAENQKERREKSKKKEEMKEDNTEQTNVKLEDNRRCIEFR